MLRVALFGWVGFIDGLGRVSGLGVVYRLAVAKYMQVSLEWCSDMQAVSTRAKWVDGMILQANA